MYDPTNGEIQWDRTGNWEQPLILVTHRLYNLKIADTIVVLKEGKIVERGTHEELVTQKGLYLKMFEKQSEATELD